MGLKVNHMFVLKSLCQYTCGLERRKKDIRFNGLHYPTRNRRSIDFALQQLKSAEIFTQFILTKNMKTRVL